MCQLKSGQITVVFTNDTDRFIKFVASSRIVSLGGASRLSVRDVDGHKHWINWNHVNLIRVKLQEKREIE